MLKSAPVAIVTAALIIGAAILASAWIQRPRYALAQLNSEAIARLDVQSGRIDVCEPNPSTIGVAKIDAQTFGVICFDERGQPTARP